MLRYTVTTIVLLATAATASAMQFDPTATTTAGDYQSRFAAFQARDERPPGPADLREAIEIAQQRFGGRVAGADTIEQEGRLVHEVRLLGDDDGIVRTVYIDPETGAIIPQERNPD